MVRPPRTSGIDDFGDPGSHTDYTFCVFDVHTAPIEILTRAQVPAGASWRAHGSRGFVYQDPTRAAGGLRSIRLKASTRPGPGTASIRLKGGGSNLGLPPSLTVTDRPYTIVQLQAGNGMCWEADFTSSRKSTPEVFQSRTGSPAGVFLDR